MNDPMPIEIFSVEEPADSGRYELLDHTADIGLEVSGRTLPALLPPAIKGLYSILGDLSAAAVKGERQERFAIIGDDPGLLLRDLLAELAFLLETAHEYVSAIRIAAFNDAELDLTLTIRELKELPSLALPAVKEISHLDMSSDEAGSDLRIRFVLDI